MKNDLVSSKNHHCVQHYRAIHVFGFTRHIQKSCRAIHEFKILPQYLFTLVILCRIWNTRIQVSTNMYIMVKPWNFVPMKINNFTVWVVVVMRSQISTTYQCVQDQSMCFKNSFFFFKFYSIKLKFSCKCNFLRCGCSQLHKIVTIYNQLVYESEYKFTFPCCFFIFYTQVPEKCEI